MSDITREEAIEILKGAIKKPNTQDGYLGQALTMGIEALENQKTGHWKKISPAGIMECSVCGGNVLTSDIECYKYCHHCGAKMEGE